MLAKLPAEIWVHIASYLPDVQLCTLYLLNRLFYQLATDSLYRTVSAARSSQVTNQMVARLRSARNPALAKRIRSLEVDLTLIRALDPRRPATVLAMKAISRMLRRVIRCPKQKHPFSRTSKSALELYNMLLDIARGAENLQRVRFNVQTLDPIATDIHWAGDIWSLVSGRVPSLVLALTGDELESILQAFENLSRVKRLCIELHLTHWDESKSACLAKLFNLASASLVSFELKMDYSSHSSAFSTVFHNLDHFPKLKRVDLYVLFDDWTGPKVVQFLNSHEGSIEQFHFLPIVGAFGSLQSLSSLHLSNLRKLRLNLRFLRVTHRRKFCDGILSFPALTDLTIISPGSDYLEVVIFSKAFGSLASPLRTLDLSISTLSRVVFDTLSTSFPQIHCLTIRAQTLAHALGVEQEWNTGPFSKRMAVTRYPYWKLSDLTVFRESDDQPPQIQWPVMRILAACTPSIQSFCGNGHMDGPSNTENNVASTRRSGTTGSENIMAWEL
ncbi:hypothetical protein AB1N83_009378 [Pleurotus pulmonarius]